MRVFSVVVILISCATMAAILVVGGHPTTRKIHFAGATIGAMAGVWSYLGLRAGHPYTPFHNTAFGLPAAFAVTTGYFFWGPLSVVVLLIPFGSFIFSIHRSLASALIVSGFAFVSHFVISMLTTLEVIPDYSAIRPIAMDKTGQLATILIVQGIFIVTFVTARASHKATRDALEELRRTVRTLSLRDQLLSEAQGELARALMIGGQGKYTNARLGSYKLGEVLGRGAMGEVYEAVHVETEWRAAVKVLRADALTSPQRVLRFLRELEMIATIESPHVVRVLEVSSLEDGLPYLAMERLEGQVLSQYLQERPRLKFDEVLEMVRQVSRGLRAAHEQGILHRDIKPQNIFLTRGKRWTVLDFGIAKLADADADMTQGGVIGTPEYMSPEQARGEELDSTSDLYSLAVVAYRSLTGRLPVPAGSSAAVLRRVATGKPQRPQGLEDHAADIIGVLAIAMAQRPADRFADGKAFAGALRQAGKGALSDELRKRALRLDTFHTAGTQSSTS